MRASEFLQWSCDVLIGQLERDVERRRSLSAKAAQVIGAVAAVVLWSITSLEKTPPAGILTYSTVVAFAALLATATMASYHSFKALRITGAFYPREDALVTPEIQQIPEKLRHFRNHMFKVVSAAEQATSEKATYIRSAERWVLGAIPIGVVAALLARIAVMLSPSGG